MDEKATEALETKNPEDLNFWKGFIIPAFFPVLFLICVILTIDMQIVDYPMLNRFFGGDDLFIFSLFNLLVSLIAWPVIGYNLPPPYHEGGKVSATIGLTGGGLVFLWGLVMLSLIGAS